MQLILIATISGLTYMMIIPLYSMQAVLWQSMLANSLVLYKLGGGEGGRGVEKRMVNLHTIYLHIKHAVDRRELYTASHENMIAIGLCKYIFWPGSSAKKSSFA